MGKERNYDDEERSLSAAFGDSLGEETVSIVGDLAETGLDSIMEDGLLKDIPFLSIAVAIYKIGGSIKERHNIKKLVVFLNEINKGLSDPKKRAEYQKKFNSKDKFRDQQIEYLLVLIDRYISCDKSQMLAKIYMAYLDEKIDFKCFCVFAEMIDRFLSGDADILKNKSEIITQKGIGTEPILRLIGLGLMIEDIHRANIEWEDGTVHIDSPQYVEREERKYKRTELGNCLAEILS